MGILNEKRCKNSNADFMALKNVKSIGMFIS